MEVVPISGPYQIMINNSKLQIFTKRLLAEWRKIWYILYEIHFALPA